MRRFEGSLNAAEDFSGWNMSDLLEGRGFAGKTMCRWMRDIWGSLTSGLSENVPSKKRIWIPNFNKDEEAGSVNIIMKYKNVVENKKTEALTKNQSNQTFNEKIERKINLDSSGDRTHVFTIAEA